MDDSTTMKCPNRTFPNTFAKPPQISDLQVCRLTAFEENLGDCMLTPDEAATLEAKYGVNVRDCSVSYTLRVYILNMC